jgi:phosphatidylglycerophosphate synthase
MSAISSWQTRANALTALRLFAAPALAAAICAHESGLALAIYALAVATDFADGWVARRYDEASPLGGFMDHAVDAAFVTTGTAALALAGALPALLPVLIALAFTQYAVDSRVGASRPLRGSSLGRYNGIAYYVLLALPITRDALQLGWPPPGLVSGLGWALIVSTLLSMAGRLRASRGAGPRSENNTAQ